MISAIVMGLGLWRVTLCCQARRLSKERHQRFVGRVAERELFRSAITAAEPPLTLELAAELFAPTFVLHDPSVPEEVRGLEALKQYVTMYRTAYPDTHFTVKDQIAEGDEVVTRWTGQGTHQGELMGIAPTGNQVTGIEIDRISGGKIEETWVSYDAPGMMQQLGVIPSSE